MLGLTNVCTDALLLCPGLAVLQPLLACIVHESMADFCVTSLFFRFIWTVYKFHISILYDSQIWNICLHVPFINDIDPPLTVFKNTTVSYASAQLSRGGFLSPLDFSAHQSKKNY